LKVNYQASDSLPADSIARTATVAFYLKAIAPDHRILVAKRFCKSRGDKIGAGEIEKVESAAFPFTRSQRKARSFFSAIVEPIIITIASGGVIYIFYSFRSK